ncbi:MAG TPA: hypothetical protein VE244_04880 [Nitrososphaeraceae archaeon]|jgi:hypothetical protein|nr:hypothetical protein [Nitrososphaeraceae archaeon]
MYRVDLFAIVIYDFDLYVVAERLKAKDDNEIKRSYNNNNNNNYIKKGNIQIEYFQDRIIIIYTSAHYR